MKAKRAQINELVRLIRAGAPASELRARFLPSNHRERTLGHPAFPGFGVRLTYTGQASWYVEYRLHGRHKKVVIGDVRTLDEKEAEAAAKDVWAKVRLDRLDPQREKQKAREAAKVIFRDVAQRFLEEHVGAALRAATKQSYTKYLTGYYLKPLHNLPLADITREQVRARLNEIRITSGQSTAHHLGWTLLSMCKWAIEKEIYMGLSPVRPSDIPKQGAARDRVLTDSEIRDIWQACELREETARVGLKRAGTPPAPDLSRVVQLLFLTVVVRRRLQP